MARRLDEVALVGATPALLRDQLRLLDGVDAVGAKRSRRTAREQHDDESPFTIAAPE